LARNDILIESVRRNNGFVFNTKPGTRNPKLFARR